MARQPEFLFPEQTGLEELMRGKMVPTREKASSYQWRLGFTLVE
jgi:hypothetical protein